MRLFYLIFLLLICAVSCKPTAKMPVSPVILLQTDQLQLQLSPAGAPVETPLTLTLTAEQLVRAQGELSGVSMYMGVIPLRFTAISADQWQAEFLLGACSDPHMRWQLVIQLEYANGEKHTIKQQLQSSWR